MTAYRRNILVGITVLTALASLGWMILRFGGDLARPFSPEQMPVRFVADRADGLGIGSAIFYLGVDVGRISAVRLAGEDGGVVIDALVNRVPPLPGNLRGEILLQTFIGGSTSMVIETDGVPAGRLEPNTVVRARYIGLSVLPPEIAEVATEIRLAVRQFRESNVVLNINEQVTRLGKLIDTVEGVVGDEKLRTDLRETLANARRVSEQANAIAADVQKFAARLDQIGDDAQGAVGDARAAIGDARKTIADTEQEVQAVGRQIADRMAQTARLLEQAQSLAEKIDRGDGTAGQLVNDRRLYEGLVETTRRLDATIQDLQRLVRQWEQEGLSLKLR
jgi:phospholipid/cholesterol/gamma-HCH transport system substrate-binding protein